MSDHDRDPPRALHAVPDPAQAHPPPPRRDPWWPFGWDDFARGHARPAAPASPGSASRVISLHGRTRVPLPAPQVSATSGNDRWPASVDSFADRHLEHTRTIHGAARMERRRAHLQTPGIILAPTGKTDADGDELVRLAGPVRGTIAVGYRPHDLGAEHPIWYLRIALAAHEESALGTVSTPVTIAEHDYPGGVVLHPLGADPASSGHNPALIPLITAVLEQWHTRGRLHAAYTAHQRGGAPPR